MRAWFDLTNSPHVLVLRPLIRALQEDGHDGSVTARDFAQTVALCERFGIDCDVIGRHRGAKLGAKAIGLVDRSYELYKYARKRRFDIAIGHGSNDISVAAKLLRVPAATMFDYEWATVQHTVNCRLAQAVVVPDAIPAERLERYGARGKLLRYAGLKEEYALADVEPDPAVLADLFRALVANNVKPYYLHHLDRAPGTSHFRVPLERGQEIVRQLRGRVSGLCQPTYMLDIPGGYGKVPIGPNYVEAMPGGHRVTDPNGGEHAFPDAE